jgi:hypothetical protein
MQETNAHKIPRACLTLSIDGPYFPLEKFREAIDHFAVVLREVDKETSSEDCPTLDWSILSVSEGSLHLTAEAIVISDDISPERPYQVVATIKKGFNAIQEKVEYPEGFSSEALKRIKKLANIIHPDDIAEISISGEGWYRLITPKMVAAIDEITSQTYKYYGSVEGKLVSISVAQRGVFGIRSPFQEKIIKCFFDRKFLPIAKESLDKRVYVYGLIRQEFHGNKLNVIVEEIKNLPEENKVSRAEDLLQVLRGEP